MWQSHSYDWEASVVNLNFLRGCLIFPSSLSFKTIGGEIQKVLSDLCNTPFVATIHLWQLCAAMMTWVGRWVELVLLTDSSATRYMKVKRIGITEFLRRIWIFSANKIKSSESGGKQPTQLIVELNSSLRHIIVTFDF